MEEKNGVSVSRARAHTQNTAESNDRVRSKQSSHFGTQGKEDGEDRWENGGEKNVREKDSLERVWGDDTGAVQRLFWAGFLKR